MLPMHIAALGLAVAAFAASGCGGSSKSPSSTTSTSSSSSTPTTTTNTNVSTVSNAPLIIATGKPLTRTVWISKGDAICGRTNTKLSATTVKNSEDFARLLPQAALYDRTEAVELSKLVPPPAMAQDWAQIVDGLQKFGELSAKAGEYAQAKNTNEGIPVFAAANKAQQEATAIAKKDGFKVCSVP
jgi:hypothetical protein